MKAKRSFYKLDQQLTCDFVHLALSVLQLLSLSTPVPQPLLSNLHNKKQQRNKNTILTNKPLAYTFLQLVHGNIKASSIFLNPQRYGCVCDLGLATVMTPLAPPVIRIGGYRAPEVSDTRKVYQASDVYSFGVVLLDLLTGKSPTRATCGEEVVHLVRWVHSVVRKEWTTEVFDVELLKYPNIEEEMVEMLQKGMQCVARSPEQRQKMKDVVNLMEDIRRTTNAGVSEVSTPMTEVTASPVVAQQIGSSVVAM